MAKPIVNLSGQKYGRLIVLKQTPNRNNRVHWLCQCDCGNTTIVSSNNLRSKSIKACGCLQKEWQDKIGKLNYSHGFTVKGKSRKFYDIWWGMKRRCKDKNYKDYYLYGARGITVCKRWLKFENFRDDMYQAYLKHVKQYGKRQTSIERIDNDNNYEPDNCKWATWKEQNNNKR